MTSVAGRLPLAALEPGEIVRRAQRDDADACTTLYVQHAAYVARVVHRLIGRDGDVDDIVQDTFVDAFDGIAALSEPSCIRAWLVAIAVRKTHRLLARRRRMRLFGLEIAFVAPKASDPRDRQPVDELYDALERIPPDLRIPWVLHQVEQMTLPDVARACDVSLATAKRRISEAEDRLRRRLAP
jgi:RNA polymerase sigma-70 factor (ECF subfamily)